METQFHDKMDYYKRATGMVDVYLKYGKVPTQCICSPDIMQLLLVDAAKVEEDVLCKEEGKSCIVILGQKLELKVNEEYTRGTLHVK